MTATGAEEDGRDSRDFAGISLSSGSESTALEEQRRLEDEEVAAAAAFCFT
jgi:hypothetical protein